jgi:hypothetical protein
VFSLTTEKLSGLNFGHWPQYNSEGWKKSASRVRGPISEGRGRRGAALYQERAVFGKMKMDPAKRAQTQNAGEVSLLKWFFSQSIELMMDKVWLHCIRPMLLK